MKKYLSVLILCLIPFSALSLRGGESNGGMGIFNSMHVRLFDFVEAEITGRTIPKDLNLPLIEKEFLPSFASQLATSLRVMNIKLIELSEVSPEFAEKLIQEWRLMTWSFVRYKLPNTKDAYRIDQKKYPPASIVQLAVRQGSHVDIQEDYFWNSHYMDQVGLIFHEGISKMYFDAMRECKLNDFSSEYIRKIVALLFMPNTPQRKVALQSKLETILRRQCP